MGNLNKVFLMGNLTRDPDMRFTQTGMAVTRIGLAVNRRVRDAGTDQWRDETDFIDVCFFGRRGEVISEYFRKGDPIFIEGRLRYSSWETPEGERRSKLEVVAENFEFISRRNQAQPVPPGPPADDRQPQRPAPAPTSQPPATPAPPEGADVEPYDKSGFGDEEVPF